MGIIGTRLYMETVGYCQMRIRIVLYNTTKLALKRLKTIEITTRMMMIFQKPPPPLLTFPHPKGVGAVPLPRGLILCNELK